MPGKLDSLGLVESLRRRMVDFASADLYVTDPDIQRAARAAWKDEASGLVGELWVEGTMPPMPGQRLQTIAEAGGFDQDLLGRLMESGAWGDWRLHEHQERAIRAAADDPGGAVMVSAGTGAGKDGELPAAARRPAVERAPPRSRHARAHPLPHERARPRPDGSPRCVARRAVPAELLPLHERDTGDRVRSGPARHREAVREPRSIPGRGAARSSRHLRDELLDARVHARQAAGRTVLRRGARGRRPR